MDNSIDKDYICDDISVEIPEYIKNMTDDEAENEFQKRFGEYVKKADETR